MKVKKRMGRPKKNVVTSDTTFNPLIENFIPSSKRDLKPHIKKMIVDTTMQLESKQSFFIPYTVLGDNTVKKVVNELKEEKKSYFKNVDVRVVISKKTDPVKGCRVVRFI